MKGELESLGAKIVVASVDPADKASEAAPGVTYPIAYGVTREMADQVGAWWEGTRNFMQPSEFVIGADGKVMVASYSSGPIGRMEPTDLVKYIKFREAQAAKK